MKGIYFVLSKLKEPIIEKVGALGEIEFKDGRYIYVGSAQNSLEGRISRHVSPNKSKHWHIDYLLEDAEIEEVLAYNMKKKKECDASRTLKKEFYEIEGFGCSDCDCSSHLFFTRDSRKKTIEKIINNIGGEDARLKDLDL